MANFKPIEMYPRIIGVGTATQATFYSQKDLLELFQIKDRRIKSIFLNGGIKYRSLKLPIEQSTKTIHNETQGELLEKHCKYGIEMGVHAIKSCLEQTRANLNDLQYLCCVTSTGLLTPGFSALLCEKLDLRRDCKRLDIVGMGCNAGLNGLNVVINWAQANPGKLAIMLCVEVCSAVYVFDGTIQTAVVNSLFGDGAAAVAVMYDPHTTKYGAAVLKFTSCIIPEALNAMRFNWDDEHGKLSFFLDPEIPYVIGAHSEQVINQLLENTTLRRSDISHWVIHSGGKKVIDSVMVNLGLTRYNLQHTFSVLRDYGNLSSGSFLFSLKRLLLTGKVKPGDNGVFMTMGPGSTIETALVQW